MLVTTSYDANKDAVLRSKALASELQCKWIGRGKVSLEKLRAIHQVNQIWIVSNQEIKYVHYELPPLFFHPSTATIRMKRLLQGEQDTLIECSGAALGDQVLDCTAGMASDAIIFSHCIGPGSKVIAIESVLTQYLIIREGLKRYNSDLTALNEAMRSIDVEYAEHYSFLKQCPDHSFDIVYFDPMFRRPLEDSSALSPLRGVANHQALQQASIDEARRVARKTVVLKEHRNSEEFNRLGFDRVYRTNSKIAYGVIRI